MTATLTHCRYVFPQHGSFRRWASWQSHSQSLWQFEWLITLLLTAVRGKRAEPQREKKRRGRKEGRGQSHKVRVMSSLLFPVVRSVAWVQPRGDARSNRRPGRNRCSYTMNMNVVGCLFTRSLEADFPFYWNKEKYRKVRRLSTCLPLSGEHVSEAMGPIFNMIYVLLKIHDRHLFMDMIIQYNTIHLLCNPGWKYVCGSTKQKTQQYIKTACQCLRLDLRVSMKFEINKLYLKVYVVSGQKDSIALPRAQELKLAE